MQLNSIILDSLFKPISLMQLMLILTLLEDNDIEVSTGSNISIKKFALNLCEEHPRLDHEINRIMSIKNLSYLCLHYMYPNVKQNDINRMQKMLSNKDSSLLITLINKCSHKTQHEFNDCFVEGYLKIIGDRLNSVLSNYHKEFFRS